MGEVRFRLLVARDQEYLTADEYDCTLNLADKVSRQFYNLIRYLEEKAEAGRVRELPGEYVAR